jgi:hypothetical protein
MITLFSRVKRMATTKMSRKVSIKLKRKETYEKTLDNMVQPGWKEERKELARNNKRKLKKKLN